MPTPDVPTISGPVSTTNFIGGGRSDANLDGVAEANPLEDLTIPDPDVDNGVWTPTIAGARYIGNEGVFGDYSRVDTVVTCAVTIYNMEFNLDPGETSFFFTLTPPVASTFANSYSVAGAGEYHSNVTGSVNVIADSVNDLISVEVQGLVGGFRDVTPVMVMCQYTVV
jgi:hypothetical protein